VVVVVVSYLFLTLGCSMCITRAIQTYRKCPNQERHSNPDTDMADRLVQRLALESIANTTTLAGRPIGSYIMRHECTCTSIGRGAGMGSRASGHLRMPTPDPLNPRSRSPKTSRCPHKLLAFPHMLGRFQCRGHPSKTCPRPYPSS